MCERYYGYVFGALLKRARRQNSMAGAPVADDEIKNLVEELTGKAFLSAFDRIEEYEHSKSALPTWIVWQGRSLSNGVVGKAIRKALHRESEIDEALAQQPGHRGRTFPANPSAEDQVVHTQITQVQREKIDSILRKMSRDQASAIVEVLAWERPIPSVAVTMGRSHVGMDSLLRRAIKEFRRLWLEEFGTGYEAGE